MPDAGWDTLVRQASGVSSEGQEIAGELKQSAGRAKDIAAQLRDMKPPEAPELIEPQKPPTTADIPSPLASFGSIASAFGMLASLMTRRPLITALNAATGAIVGAKQGNQEEFKRNYEVWKQNSEYANEVNAWQTKRYQMIMDQYRSNIDQMQGALSAEAHAHNDLVAAHTIESGDLRNFENLLYDRASLAQRNAELGVRLAEQKPMLDAYMDLNAVNKELAAAKKSGDPNKIADATKKVEDARNNVAETIRKTDPRFLLAEERQTTLRAKQQQAVASGQSLLKDVQRVEKMIEVANAAGISTSGKLGMLTSLGEAFGIKEGDIASRVRDAKAALRLKAESYLGRSRPNVWTRTQIDSLIKGAGLGETDVATISGLRELEGAINDEIAIQGGTPGTAPPEPELGGALPLPTIGGVTPSGASSMPSGAGDDVFQQIYGGQ